MTSKTPISQIHSIDDSDDETFLLRLLLESQNVQVELVHHTNYGSLEKMVVSNASKQPLLILADLNMPAMKGDQVIKSLLETHGKAGISIGICSGSEDPADKLSAEGAGADFFVNKPLDLNSLTKVCEACSELALLEGASGTFEIVRAD